MIYLPVQLPEVQRHFWSVDFSDADEHLLLCTFHYSVPVWVTKHWSRLPRAVVESPSLEIGEISWTWTWTTSSHFTTLKQGSWTRWHTDLQTSAIFSLCSDRKVGWDSEHNENESLRWPCVLLPQRNGFFKHSLTWRAATDNTLRYWVL